MISLNPKRILGGIVGSYEDDGYEKENTGISAVTQGIGEAFQDILEEVTGIESNNSSTDKEKFPSQGSIEFNKNQAKAEDDKKKQEATTQKRVFYQAIKQDQVKVQNDKEKAQFEEEMNDITANISTEEKNRLLHYQSSYRDKSTYQRAELRKKIIEERKKSEKQKTEASMAETQSGASAMQTAFEGGSGSQGAGQANLSAHATG